MACKTSYELHHNFPKLAEESGFTFSTHKPRVHIEWNKIRLIDIESLIRDRKFIQIEQHLDDILDCVLESEFDVRILDEGVLKIFRLAQLSVEYQQFCRHYLDRSVYVLREEITALAQELEYAKKTIREKEDEIRKLKRKTKYNIRAPLPYGNDNIANMILQTLANKSDIFPTTTQVDNVHYNKCNYCDKVFMNQLYLKSHMSRRHSNVVLEIPQKELPRNEDPQVNNEQTKLQNEIVELKSKLKEMEVLIKFSKVQENRELNSTTRAYSKETEENCSKEQAFKINGTKSPEKETKDAEVSINSDGYILEKIEEWKKEEFEKYNKEISLLRTQIATIIDCNKDIAKSNSVPNDNKIMEQLQETIKQQNAEITSLKEELIDSRLKSKNEELERKKEIDAQIALWAERTEAQSKEYKVLLQKLDTVAMEAQKSRELAELEKQRALKLQNLLEQNRNNVKIRDQCAGNHPDNEIITGNRQNRNEMNENLVNAANERSPQKSTPMPDRKTLEKLHRKAQELLNQSITSSDASSTSDSKIQEPIEKRTIARKTITSNKRKTNENNIENEKEQIHKENTVLKKAQRKRSETNKKARTQETKKNKSPTKKDNGFVNKTGSPIKIVRAKLTEEVNQRLVSLGVDPLKKRLPRDVFKRHQLEIQENNEIKSKKNPGREKIIHYIMSYLDKKAITKEETKHDEYFSPNRSSKPFSLTSVISNVKSKALSLVKTNEGLRNEEKSPYDIVTRKALHLVRTPPASTTASPKIDKQYLGNQLQTKKASNQGIDEKEKPNTLRNTYSDKNSDESDSNSTDSFQISGKKISNEKSIQNNPKSPNRRPATNSIVYDYNMQGKLDSDTRTSVNTRHITNAFEQTDTYQQNRDLKIQSSENSSDDNIVVSITDHELRKAISDENVNGQKQTKGVLKSASSMSSLYKKKVIFDMDAIQMKSVSASPSQSITEKSDTNEKVKVGVMNLDTEEWDLSSIENEPLKDERTIKISSRTSSKIAELKQSIESQLTRRNQTLSTALVGGVDVLQGPRITKAASLGGSNTSLGSSILDDSEYLVHQNHTAFVKPKKLTDKDDSEIEISEVVDDIVENKHKSFM